MTYGAPLLLLISLVMACFTSPDGLGIWVSKTEVIAVLHAADCAKGANTKILTTSGSLCVQESPQQVLKLLDDAK
jgi:hypothetical protein